MAVSFENNFKIVSILNGLQTAANTDRNSEVIDTLGYHGVLIIVKYLTVHNSATQAMFLISSDVAANETTLTSSSAVLDSNQAIAGTDDNKVFCYQFIPDKRYYQLTINKDATNAGDEVAIAILYNPGTLPVVQAAGGSTVGEGTVATTMINLGKAIQGASGA